MKIDESHGRRSKRGNNVDRGLDIDGIHYIRDARGRRKAVVLDLEKHGDLWEDIHDILVVRSRQKKPRVSLESVLERHLKRADRRRAKSVKTRRT